MDGRIDDEGDKETEESRSEGTRRRGRKDKRTAGEAGSFQYLSNSYARSLARVPWENPVT